MKQKRLAAYNKGVVDGWMISTIGLIILVLGFGSLAIWAYLNYNEAKTDIDGKIELAKAEAKRDQAEADETKYREEEKNPRRDFIGPEDYGRVSFTYPKTWSVYVSKDAVKGGNYETYFHPVQVPPTSDSTQLFALRFQILDQDYDKYVGQFEARVKSGKLRSETVSVNGENGLRFDGNFTEKLRGALVVFKVRDKTVVFMTDADTFKPDFDALIQTVTYVK